MLTLSFPAPLTEGNFGFDAKAKMQIQAGCGSLEREEKKKKKGDCYCPVLFNSLQQITLVCDKLACKTAKWKWHLEPFAVQTLWRLRERCDLQHLPEILG